MPPLCRDIIHVYKQTKIQRKQKIRLQVDPFEALNDMREYRDRKIEIKSEMEHSFFKLLFCSEFCGMNFIQLLIHNFCFILFRFETTKNNKTWTWMEFNQQVCHFSLAVWNSESNSAEESKQLLSIKKWTKNFFFCFPQKKVFFGLKKISNWGKQEAHLNDLINDWN